MALRRLLGAGPVTPVQQLFLNTDWARTPLGDADRWSPTLQAAISTVLTSRFPMLVMAGTELIMVYNDAYAPMLGTRHPSLGRPLQEVWSDVWPQIGPMIEDVWNEQQATYAEDLPLIMTRHGFAEETYFTFSYSPLLDPQGTVIGLLDTAIETTGRVLAARRLDLAQRLGTVAGARFVDVDTACAALLELLATRRVDCPLAEVFLLEDADDPTSPLRRRGGYGTGHPDRAPAGMPADARTALGRAVRGERVTAEDVSSWWPAVHPAPAEVGGGGAVEQAQLLPLVPPGQSRAIGVLIVGLSPHLRLDDEYRTFLSLLAGQMAAVFEDTLSRRTERAAAVADRTMAAALQRSLLTDPVQPDHLEIAVRYLPAARQAQVGGDWYDAFLSRDGATWLVVGDVAGHDHNAAAAMAQVRNVLRGIAHTLQRSPAEVLTAVDAAMAGLGMHALTTVVAVRIEQTAADAAAGVRRVRWSNAGHPPPVLINGAGAEALITRPERLLGVDPAAGRTDHEHVLRVGDCLLLYSDGLVERRGRDLDAGTAWLLGEARAGAGIPLDDLCNHLLESVADHADDDIALLALRAHPEGASDHAPVIVDLTGGSLG